MPPDPIGEHRFDAMGTTCSVFASGVSSANLRRTEMQVRELAARLTRFDPDSELSRFNAAAGEWTPVSPELEALLRESLRAFEMSAGLVNVAVLPSMVAIGYTRTLADGPTDASPWTAQSAPPLPDVLKVAVGTARLSPGVGIDLGGIAKGWMADRLCARLAPNALVNLGGDLRARGAGPDGDGWPVGLGETTVLLDDHAAATSGALRTGVLDWLGSNRALRSLHEYATVLWVPLGVLHVTALVLDSTARVGLLDVFVPFRAPYGTLAIGLGTLSLDLLLVVTITSFFKRRMRSELWRWVHRLAYLAFALVFVHAVLGGTDFSDPIVSAITWAAAAGLGILAVTRVFAGRLTT